MHPRRFLPSIALLTAFDAAARHLNFTNAAKELFLTQSAISRQVRSLENQLDKELFIRQGREIILSPAGKAYAQEVQKILAHLRYATQQATNHSKPESLNIALTPIIGTKWLLPRLPEFYEQHPELELNISTHIGELDLAKNDIDAYLTDTERPEDSLNAYPLMNANIIIVMSPALFKLNPIYTIEDIYNHNLLQAVSNEKGWRYFFNKNKLNKNKLKQGPTFELTSHLIQAVYADIGIALISDIFVASDIMNGTLLSPYLPNTLIQTKKIYLLTSPLNYNKASLNILKNWIIQQANN